MGKKQQKNQEVAKPLQVQAEVEQTKEDIIERASKALSKFVPHEKYILRKTKLINKKKNQAIEFIKLDKFQVAKAIQCLKEFDQKNKNAKNLFSEDGFIYLEFDLSKVPEHYTIRPVQISLPCPIYSQKYNSRFTVFSTDPQTSFTDKIQDLSIPQIAQVIGYEKLKKSYKQNQDKLKLLSGNDLFFCDWKIYNLLRQPLGKVFYDKKKYPFPIDCEDVPEDLKTKFATYEEYINDLGNHSYFMMGNGPVYSLKIGRLSMESPDLVKNIMRGVYRTIPHIIGADLSPSDLRQITIKTFNSPSLPIYNFLDEKLIKAFKSEQKLVKAEPKATQQIKSQKNTNSKPEKLVVNGQKIVAEKPVQKPIEKKQETKQEKKHTKKSK